MTILDRKTVVVSGGAGFIGSHLCEWLMRQKHRVICVDNLHTGSYRNLAAISLEEDFVFIEHDVTEPLLIPEPIHRIYNLACPASPIHYQENPIATLRTCVLGACNLLELAKAKKARILQASTSEVYGDPEVHPPPEQYRNRKSVVEGKRG